ncbi:DUF6356 family protein [Aestuariibius sp. 2305UL40-4]|uniref:DUF6356 family protein n=1 Tax=Aestuariibius violaceus TaxID=3234132 RepID=UPI00345E42EE
MQDQDITGKQTSILSAFTAHPQKVGESYWQHFGFAMRFSFRLLRAAAAAALHALIPALCETTASREVRALNDMLLRRSPGTSD